MARQESVSRQTERRRSAKAVAYAEIPNLFDPCIEPSRPARMDGSQTTWDAGKPSTQAKRRSRSLLRESILAVLVAHPGGLTDADLVELHPGAHPGSVAKRRHDLVVAGLVRASDRTRATAYGAQAIVWEAI